MPWQKILNMYICYRSFDIMIYIAFAGNNCMLAQNFHGLFWRRPTQLFQILCVCLIRKNDGHAAIFLSFPFVEKIWKRWLDWLRSNIVFNRFSLSDGCTVAISCPICTGSHTRCNRSVWCGYSGLGTTVGRHRCHRSRLNWPNR